MRLTCPNCDAQYEVPDNVVPTEGRDVQCSSCGQTWFQHHPDYEADGDDVDDVVAAVIETSEQGNENSFDRAPTIEYSQGREAQMSVPPPVPQNKGLDDLDDLPEAPVSAFAQRKELDPAVADILRQEARAEQDARDAQRAETLESQPDLGLTEAEAGAAVATAAADRTLQARQRMARLRGEPEPMSDADINAAAVSSRRDLLPDIDEINSTLRTETNPDTTSTHAQIEAPSTTRRKRSFRKGFLIMLVLFVLLVALYIYAPAIGRAVPQLDGALTTYVSWVDQLRLWLDGHVQNLLRWLDTMATRSDT